MVDQTLTPTLVTNTPTFPAPYVFFNRVTLTANAIESSSGLTNITTTRLNADDGSYATNSTGVSSTNFKISFSFAGTLRTGAGLQVFTVKARKTTNDSGPTPTVFLRVVEGGVTKATGSNTFVPLRSSDATITLTWDASILADPTGKDAQLQAVGSSASDPSPPFLARAVEYDYAEWLADTTSWSILPTLFTDSNTFFLPSLAVVNTVTVPKTNNSNTFYSFDVSRLLTPPVLGSTGTFYAPAVSAIAFITPGVVTNVSIFYGTAVQINPIQLLIPKSENDNRIYPPVLEHKSFSTAFGRGRTLRPKEHHLSPKAPGFEIHPKRTVI